MELEVLWQRVTVNARTCARCADTGLNVRRAVDELEMLLAPHGVTVQLVEKPLPPFAVQQSNRVFLGGLPLEEILGAQVAMNHCQSCCDLLGAQTDCRVLRLGGRDYEELPSELVVQAGMQVAKKLWPERF